MRRYFWRTGTAATDQPASVQGMMTVTIPDRGAFDPTMHPEGEEEQ